MNPKREWPQWSRRDFMKAEGNPMQTGERIYNLEKLFNYREGFGRDDNVIPDRFFEEPLTVGEKKGAVLTRALNVAGI